MGVITVAEAYSQMRGCGQSCALMPLRQPYCIWFAQYARYFTCQTADERAEARIDAAAYDQSKQTQANKAMW